MFESFNFNSPEWVALRERAEKRLQELREKNDSINLSERETAVLRGQIQELKDFLAIPEQVLLQNLVAPSL